MGARVNSKTAGVKPAVFLLALILFVSNVSESIYTPALINIAHAFFVSKTYIQFTVTVFIFTFAICQLLYGFISDHIGRRPVLMIGLTIFSVGTLIAGCATTWWILLVARMFQGAGAAAGSVLVRAMVRDAFDPPTQRRIFSYILAIVTLAPLLGASIGGFVVSFLGWRYVFVLLLLLIITTFMAVYWRLPETYVANKLKKFKWGLFFKEAIKVYKNRTFAIHAIIGGLLLSIPFVYLIEAPFVFIVELKLTPYQYGLLFMFITVGSVFGSMVSAKCSYIISRSNTILLGLVIAFIAALMLFFNVYITNTVLTIMVPITIIIFGVLMAKSNVSMAALQPFSDNAGLASALLGFSQMMLAAIISYITQLIPETSALMPMGVMIAGLLFVALVLHLFWSRNSQKL